MSDVKKWLQEQFENQTAAIVKQFILNFEKWAQLFILHLFSGLYIAAG